MGGHTQLCDFFHLQTDEGINHIVGEYTTCCQELAVLVLGFQSPRTPFASGILAASMDFVVPGLSTDDAGELALQWNWPEAAPPQLTTYYQMWIADRGSPVGIAGSNGLITTSP